VVGPGRLIARFVPAQLPLLRRSKGQPEVGLAQWPPGRLMARGLPRFRVSGLAQYFRPEVVENALDLLKRVPLTMLAGGTETCREERVSRKIPRRPNYRRAENRDSGRQ
jgi:hypothetical protein